MQRIEDFQLSQTHVMCPSCDQLFMTPQLDHMPLITPDTPIETDLHRVLPNGAVRASLVGSCGGCGYSWWITAFKLETKLNRELTADEYSMERIQYPRKFANAIVTGREAHAHPRELALLAANGAWCAREAGLPHERWLDLAAQEMEKALSEATWTSNRGYYHYMMGELCRQLKDFQAAVKHFDHAFLQSRLPKELVCRQKVQAIAADASATRLPPYLVEQIFCPRRPRKTTLGKENN